MQFSVLDLDRSMPKDYSNAAQRNMRLGEIIFPVDANIVVKFPTDVKVHRDFPVILGRYRRYGSRSRVPTFNCRALVYGVLDPLVAMIREKKRSGYAGPGLDGAGVLQVNGSPDWRLPWLAALGPRVRSPQTPE